MKNPVTRSTLFLTELVVDLFIFVVCCTVCVGLLAKARDMSRQSARLTEAIYLAQSCAEALRVSGDAPLLPDTPDGYAVEIEYERGRDSGLCAAAITVTFEGETVYTLDCAYPEGVSP